MSHEALEADANLRTIQKLLDDAQARERVIVELREELARVQAERDAIGLLVTQEWANAIAAIASDVLTNLELDIRVTLKPHVQGDPFFHGKMSVLQTLKDLVADDVQRFTGGAALLDAVRRAAEFLPGRPDAAEALLSRILEGV